MTQHKTSPKSTVCLLPLEHPSSLAEMAYQALKETVLNMHYNAEERLDERELAEKPENQPNAR